MFRHKEKGEFDSASSYGDASGATPTSGEQSSMLHAPQTASAPATPTTTHMMSAPSTASVATAPSRPMQEAPKAPSATPSASFRAASPMAPRGNDMRNASTASNADKNNAKGGRSVLTVGNNINLKGEIATCDRLVIEGQVDATLNDVHTVEIAETGSFHGIAQIEDAEISGVFEGELVVRNRLIIYSTGKVRGKISYSEIEIERGGELTGEIRTTSGAAKNAAMPANKPAAAA